MTDYFELLKEPRRQWLEADTLKQKFLALSASIHPDKIHSSGEAEKSAAAKQFAELNAAYNCLLEPKSRLLHLLELELGAKPRTFSRFRPHLPICLRKSRKLVKARIIFLPRKAGSRRRCFKCSCSGARRSGLKN